jgi:nucleoside-diphosphate-sugar epimerase
LGWTVAALSRTQPAQVIEGVTYATQIELESAPATFDALIHAAAVRHRHGVPSEIYGPANLALTRDMLALAKRSRIQRFVDISSISVYGWPPRLPINESYPTQPIGPYGRSKAESERLVVESGLPYTIVQPSITYGPGDTNGMIDKMLHMVSRGRFVVPALGNTRVQLVYIDDLARIICLATTDPKALGERFIATYRNPIFVSDLVSLLAQTVRRFIVPVGPPMGFLRLAARGFELLDAAGLWNGEPPLTREKLDTISVDRAYKIDKMRALLGTEPQVGYAEGLRRTAVHMGLR